MLWTEERYGVDSFAPMLFAVCSKNGKAEYDFVLYIELYVQLICVYYNVKFCCLPSGTDFKVGRNIEVMDESMASHSLCFVR